MPRARRSSSSRSGTTPPTLPACPVRSGSGRSTWPSARRPAGQKQRVGGLIGSPDTIRERLAKFEESNVDQVILLNQAGKNTHEDICSSLELFAREVMPEFHGREPEHQAWKQSVLAGELELEELDTEPFATPRRGR